MIGLLFRMIPLLGPILTLGGFLPRLLHLKREKAIHREAGEAFPQNYQAEIDAHTVRTQIAGWRLTAGVLMLTTLGTGFLWYGANLKIDEAETALAEKERMRAGAVAERDRWYVNYTNGQNEMIALKVRVSEESIRREGLIRTDVAKRTVARKGRLDVEKKLPATSIDPGEWMRVERVQGGDAPAAPTAISNPGSVPEGAG